MDEAKHARCSFCVVYTDLHLKMSKKIAQLTKVVFHLNTRNEDYQLEYAFMKDSNARTIQKLTSESASKLSDIEQHYQKQLSGLCQQLSEREEGYRELERESEKMQISAKLREETMVKKFEQHVTLLESQLEVCQRECMERLSHLTQLVDTKKKILEQNAIDSAAAMKQAHDIQLAELNEKHLEELQGIEDRSNVRYNQMCSELTAQKNTIIERLENERKAWNLEITKLNENLSAVEKSMTEKDEYGKNQQHAAIEMKQEFVAKMEKLLSDTEELRLQNALLRSENENLWHQQSELNAALKHAELNGDKLKQERDSVEKDYELKNQNLLRNLNNNALKIESMATELMNLQKVATEKDMLLKNSLKDIERMELGTAETRMQFAHEMTCQEKRLQDQEKKCIKMNEERNQLQQELEKAQAHFHDTSKHYQQVIDRLEKETIPLLRQQSASIEKERAKLEQEQVRLIKENSGAREKLQEDIRTALARLDQQKSEHHIVVENLHTTTQRKIGDLEVKYKCAQKDALCQQRQQLEEERARAIAEMESASRERIAQMQKESGDKQTAQQEALRKECEYARSAAEKFNSQIQQLHSQLKDRETSMDEYKRRLETVLVKDNELLNQVQQMTLQMEGEKLAYAEKVRRNDQDWMSKLTDFENKCTESHDEKLRNAITSHEAQCDSLRRLVEEAQRDCTSFSGKYKEAVRASGEEKRMDWEFIRAHLSSMELTMEAKIAQEHTAARHQIALLQQQHTEDLARHDEKKDTAYRTQVEDLLYHTRIKREKLIRKHKEALESQSTANSKLLQETKIQLENDRICDMNALRQAMNEKWSAAERQAFIERERLLGEKSATHMKEFEQWQVENEILRKDLEANCVDFQTAKETIVRLEDRMKQMQEEMTATTAEMKKNAEERIQDVKNAAKEELGLFLEENMMETKALNDHFEETKTFMEGNLLELKMQLEEWKVKYANRESRPEDLERIASLEESVRHKNLLIRKTLDEMAYFKREMLNREEMYNKTFARNPNVGLLQVLKPHVSLQQKSKPEFVGIVSKTHPSSSSASKPRVSTNQTISPNVKATNASETSLWKEENGSLSNGVRSTLPPIT